MNNIVNLNQTTKQLTLTVLASSHLIDTIQYAIDCNQIKNYMKVIYLLDQMALILKNESTGMVGTKNKN